MAEGVTSVRLGELTEAVDREAALARRSRSEMIRYLIEDGLAARRTGFVRQLSVDDFYVERFEGCPTPEMGATYRVTRQEWNHEYRERVILEYERTPDPDSNGIHRGELRQ